MEYTEGMLITHSAKHRQEKPVEKLKTPLTDIISWNCTPAINKHVSTIYHIYIRQMI